MFEVLGLTLEAWGASWEPLGRSLSNLLGMTFANEFGNAFLKQKSDEGDLKMLGPAAGGRVPGL